MIRRLLFSVLLLSMCFASAPASVAAFNPFGSNVCNSNTHDSAACQASNSDPIAGPNGVLLKITNIIAFLAGALAVIMIIVSAIRFITSGSDVSTGSRTDTDVEEARRSIASALVGLVVIVLARAIIVYVIRRL